MVKKKLYGILIAVIPILIFAPAGFSEDYVTISEGEVTSETEVAKSEGKTKKSKKKTKFGVLNERIILLEEKLSKMEHEEKIRKQLESAEEEAASQEDNEEDILAAAGEDYTLMAPGLIGLNYGFSYSGTTYDSFVDSQKIEHNANHSITNSLSVEYPIKDNLTYNLNINFKTQMNTQSNSQTTDVTDLGDTTFGLQWQPTKSAGGGLSRIINFSVSCPTGRSPYKINPRKELSTGNGGYATTIGYNMSMPIDPVFVYGSVSYIYSFPITGLNYHQGEYDGEAQVYLETVIPGHQFRYSIGFGYSLSYSMSVNFGYSYGYSTKTEYKWFNRDDYSTADNVSSSLSMGTNWNITPKRKMSVSIDIGLSNNSPDFTLSVSVPFKIET